MKGRIIYTLLLVAVYSIPYFDYIERIKLGLVDSPTDLIQFWLFISAVWVAYETLKLRKLTSKQIEIQIAPVLVVYFRENPERITVRNVGQGVAFDVKFEKITIFLEDVKKEAKYDLNLYDPPVLIPDEERKIKGAMYLNGEEILKGTTRDENGTVWLIPKYASADFEFVISYFDMQKNKYISKVSAGRKGVKLLNYKRAS